MKRLTAKWAHVLATFFTFAAAIVVKPSSFIIFYEPEAPEELFR